MGFVFPQNFRSPYRATGFRDFWRRWHMTLSRFLRDFLYIPLGGNRGGRLLTYRNLMITMVLGGLWHGAAWTFVLWGAFHGAGLVAEHALGGRIRTPGVAALGGDVPPRRLRLDPVPLAEPRPASGMFLSRLVVPGAATLWTPPSCSAIVVVIGLQLLPSRPRRADPVPARAAPPAGARGRLRGPGRCSSARPCPARASPRSSTSASEMRRRTDDSLMNRFDEHGLRRFRARDGVAAVLLAALLLVLVRGRVDPQRGRADEPGRRAATSCCSSASRRAGSPTSCRWPRHRARRDRVAVARRAARRGGQLRRAAQATARRRRASRRSPPPRSTPPTLGAKPAPRRRCTSCW